MLIYDRLWFFSGSYDGTKCILLTGVVTYDGLETCILNNRSYENDSRTSRDDGFPTDSLDEDDSSYPSSKDAFTSFSSKWSSLKRDDHDREMDDWELVRSPQHFYVKEKPVYTIKPCDVEMMKETFARLLLGDDTTGGKEGLSSALTLSKAISSLAGNSYVCSLQEPSYWLTLYMIREHDQIRPRIHIQALPFGKKKMRSAEILRTDRLERQLLKNMEEFKDFYFHCLGPTAAFTSINFLPGPSPRNLDVH